MSTEDKSEPSVSLPVVQFVDRSIDSERRLLRSEIERAKDENTSLKELLFADLSAFKQAVAAQFVAVKEATAATFSSSQAAIVKAETAQSDYNIRSNEFRGQLDDQAKTLMSKDEAIPRFDTLGIRVDGLREYCDAQFNAIKDANEKRQKEVNDNINSLRESRSEVGGKEKATARGRERSDWSIGLIIAILLGLIDLLAILYTKK